MKTRQTAPVLIFLVLLCSCGGTQPRDPAQAAKLTTNLDGTKRILSLNPIEWTGIGLATTHGPGGYHPVSEAIFLSGTGPLFVDPMVSIHGDNSRNYAQAVGKVYFDQEKQAITIDLRIRREDGSLYSSPCNGTWMMPDAHIEPSMPWDDPRMWPRPSH